MATDGQGSGWYLGTRDAKTGQLLETMEASQGRSEALFLCHAVVGFIRSSARDRGVTCEVQPLNGPVVYYEITLDGDQRLEIIVGKRTH